MDSSLDLLSEPPSSADLIQKMKQLLTPLIVEAEEQPPTNTDIDTNGLPADPPAPPPLPSLVTRLAARARAHHAKHEARQYQETITDEFGPQAYNHTKLYTKTSLIAMEAILDDPEFTNFRRAIDPSRLTELQESIELEGLKVPIVVVEAPVSGYYHVRAGFRRVMAIRNLRWFSIPAIVLPPDTPELEEYWINIIENTAREKLNTYELAEAAKLMRDRFKIAPKDFAKKAGHAYDYIQDLLLCIDRLPLEVLENWRNGAKLPLKILVKLSTLSPTEAVRNCRLWLGQHRIDPTQALKMLERKPVRSDRLWSVRGIERLQKLHMAIKVSRLSDDTKRVCLDIVEYLQGARKHVPGLIQDRTPEGAATGSTSESDLIRPLLPVNRNENPPNHLPHTPRNQP